MRVAVVPSVFLLLASTSLGFASPQAGSAATPGVVLDVHPLGVDCPVSFAVRRTSPTEVVNVDQAAGYVGDRRPNQRIHLSIEALDRPAVREAQLTVHAVSPTPHISPVSTISAPDTIDRDFHLSASTHAGLRERDLWVSRVGSVISVDLTSITYVDGSVWHRSPASTCRAVPSSFMLVSSK